ncbi:hypothetical protein BHE74_00009372 [Ensete ventricosum]|nr:hypothetical protein BHE74_00009372 [Ensete ventricosum]
MDRITPKSNLLVSPKRRTPDWLADSQIAQGRPDGLISPWFLYSSTNVGRHSLHIAPSHMGAKDSCLYF